MKTVGIVGGIGPESTIDYYRQIIAGYRERISDGSYPSVLINSIDMKRMLDLVGRQARTGLCDYLLEEIRKLVRGGADFAVLASNTPHLVFDELQAQSPIPLVSIVETACAAARAQGLKRVGLLGTRFTMEGEFYAQVFARAGIAVLIPSPEERAYVHDKYMNELVRGVIVEATRVKLLEIIKRMKRSDRIEGVILGGTELPLILREEKSGGIPFLDTTRLHVEQIVARLT